MLETSTYKDISIAKESCFVAGGETKVFLFSVDGLLVDTGPESRAKEFTEWFPSQNIKQVALTHNHEDHAGNAPWIQENLHVPIYLHAGGMSYCYEEAMYPKYRQEMWGHRTVFDPQPMPEVIKTDKYTFEVLDTPGHAMYHNCFYEKSQGWLFTGDLYLSTKLIFCYFEENIRQTIDAIERLLKLDFDTIFCAHAGVVENGKVRLEKKYNYLKTLQAQVHEMRKQGKTDLEIDAELNAFELPLTPVSCGEWSTYNIIRTI